MPKPALKTIYSTFLFRAATQEECEHRLWSTLFYQPVLEEGPFPTEAEAMEVALREWDVDEQQIPFIIRYDTLPGFLGGSESGWCVYYLDLIPVAELSGVRSGRVEAYVKTLGESPFTMRAEAVSAARWEWKKRNGRTGIVVATEVLEKHEVVDRRLARSQKLALGR